MNIMFYHPTFNAQQWQAGMQQRLPGSTLRIWQPGTIVRQTMRWSGCRRMKCWPGVIS